MSTFPATLACTGLTTPLGDAYDIESLDIDGDMPGDVEGAFFRFKVTEHCEFPRRLRPLAHGRWVSAGQPG